MLGQHAQLARWARIEDPMSDATGCLPPGPQNTQFVSYNQLPANGESTQLGITGRSQRLLQQCHHPSWIRRRRWAAIHKSPNDSTFQLRYQRITIGGSLWTPCNGLQPGSTLSYGTWVGPPYILAVQLPGALPLSGCPAHVGGWAREGSDRRGLGDEPTAVRVPC